MQCIYGQIQTSIYVLMHQYQEQNAVRLNAETKSDIQKCRISRLLKLPHMFHKLFLVNQSLELAVMQNAHVSKSKFDKALIDQV
jgi:hypothetical protein